MIQSGQIPKRSLHYRGTAHRGAPIDFSAWVAFVGAIIAFGFNWESGLWGVSLLTAFWVAAWLFARTMIGSTWGASIWILSLLAWPGLWPQVLSDSSEAWAAIASFMALGLIYRARRKRFTGMAWLSLLALACAVRWFPESFGFVIVMTVIWGQVIARLYPSEKFTRLLRGTVFGAVASVLLFGIRSASLGTESPPVPPTQYHDWVFFKGWFYLTLLSSLAVAHFLRRRQDRWTGFALLLMTSGWVDVWLRVGGGSLYNSKVFLWSALVSWCGLALLLRAPEA